ncbi:MAG: SPOR domain-containing protein [Bacteroidota bacterium]|nr:SPOR domain-containing protein [Bacteroidota bacterium]MDP3143890.1 SPOR domain-containing protein [Bacteroidota bacterium]
MKNFYLIILLLAINFCSKAQVTMVTNIPKSIAPSSNLNMEVKLNKGSIANFSKYELELPEGFEASEGNSKTGYFTFEKNRVKIVWVTLPTEPEFVVSFKLKTPSTTGPVVLNHKFSYIETGVKKEVIGQQIDVKIDPNGVSKTLSYLPEQPEEPVKVIEANVPPTPSNTVAPSTKTLLATSEPTIASVANPVSTSSNTSSASNDGLTYLVQIGTFSSDPGKAKYSDLGKVTIEKAGAVYKVLIGDFNTKEEAFKKKDDLVIKGYNGFVVTYKNGERAK